MQNIVHRLGILFWMDLTLLLWVITSIASYLYLDSLETREFLLKVDIVFTILLSIPTLYVKDPDANKKPKPGNNKIRWKMAWIFLLISGLINIFRFEIQSMLSLDYEFPLRATILFILAILVFISLQAYFLKKRIW